MTLFECKPTRHNQAIMILGTISLCLLMIFSEVKDTRAYGPIAEQLDALKSGSASVAVIDNPEITAQVLESLLHSVVSSANVDFQSITTSSSPQKRGLDLGISRGFSGSQAGKHLMGLSAASFANGPGRK